MKARTLTAALAAITVSFTAAACGGSSGGADAESAAPTTTSSMINHAERPTNAVDEVVTIKTGRMHIRCDGRGDTTVLLMAGWGNSSETWSTVQPTIAETSRVCAYDRFGTGTSDQPATVQTFETQVSDLHELLAEIGEPGPYVVVGHSFGGAEAITFASRYSDEVVGLGLIDASPTTWPDTVCSVPAYAGGCAVMHDPTQDVEQLDVFRAFEAVATITSLGDLEMSVVTAAHRSADGLTPDELTRLDSVWAAGTERWARLSTASKIVTVEDTGHDIHRDQPATVIDEVMELLG